MGIMLSDLARDETTRVVERSQLPALFCSITLDVAEIYFGHFVGGS